MPTPSAAAAWSPAAATSVDSCAAGSHSSGISSAVAHLVRPAPPATSKSSVPRRVRGVDRQLAGQAEADVVLRQQDVADPRVRLRLVRAQPEQLRRREAGERAVARQLDQPLEPDAPLDLGALGRRALVVPEDRRPQHAVVLVEHDEPVHLPGEPDRARPAARASRRCAARPPVLGILLRPARLRRRERIRLGRGREHLARRRRDRDPLDAGRADVEPDQARSAHAPSAAYTSSYARTASFSCCAARSAASSMLRGDPVDEPPLQHASA